MTDIKQLLPTDIREALLGANAPSGANPFATMADAGAGPFPTTAGNTLGTCVTTIFVSTINSCSPLAINPTNGEYVGIGIAIPTDKLEVRAADQKGISVSRLADSVVTSKLYTQNGIGGLVTLHDDTGSLKIAFIGGGTAGNGAHSYINTTANFGVGLNTPTSKLHIRGVGVGATNAVKVDNLANTELFSIRDDGNVFTSRYLLYITNNNNLIDFGASGGVELRSNIVTSMLSPIVYLSSASDHYIKLESTGRKILLRGDFLDFYQSANNIGSVFNVTNAINATVAYFYSSLAGTFLGVGITTPTATVHIKGITSDISSHGLQVQNSSNALSLQVRNDGSVYNLGKNSIATNTAFGKLALGSITTGGENTAFGDSAGIQISTGTGNTMIGYWAGYTTTTGAANTYVGDICAYTSNSSQNAALGYAIAVGGTIGSYNSIVGVGALNTGAGYGNSVLGNGSGGAHPGDENVIIGFESAKLSSGNSNIFIGANAGRHTTTDSNVLFIDSLNRGSAAADKTNSLIYGVFAATPANQRLTINANVGIQGPATGTSSLNITGLPTSTTGLVAGDVWNNAGVLNII